MPKKESAEGRFNSGKLRSNSKRSETEIIYLSTVEIRRTAKLRFLKSSVQHWKWWLCKSSRSHLQLSLGLRNIWYGCHSRFLSASEASEPPVSHTSTSPSAREADCCSAIRWKCALGKFSPGMLCESCPTPPGHVLIVFNVWDVYAETGAVSQRFEEQIGHRSLYRGPLHWHGLWHYICVCPTSVVHEKCWF